MQVGEFQIKGYGYGYGLRVLLNAVEAGTLASAGEYGWSGVAHTYCWIDPNQELIGIFMTQFLPPFTHTTHWVFRELMYQAIDR